jgi:hypothetical protein
MHKELVLGIMHHCKVLVVGQFDLIAWENVSVVLQEVPAVSAVGLQTIPGDRGYERSSIQVDTKSGQQMPKLLRKG